MDYNKLFSLVVSRSKASAIRELLKVISRPEIISFAGGLPDPDLFPTQDVADIMAEVVKTSPKEALQYGTTEGQGTLKKESYIVVFDTGNKKLSFMVSEFSFANYRVGEKGTLTYKGDRLIDFK